VSGGRRSADEEEGRKNTRTCKEAPKTLLCESEEEEEAGEGGDVFL